MAIQKHTIGETDSAIWAETDNINYFLSTTLTPDSADSVTNVQMNKPGHSRRQYPGDTSLVSVSSHTATTIMDPGRKSGNAIPGKPFVVTDGTEKRQFRYTGDWTDVHALFVGDVANETTLYSATGTRYIIAATSQGLSTKAKATPKPASV